MTVLVYVEGASDKQGLQDLLQDLLVQKQREGTSVQFIERDSKGDILVNGPKKAISILRNRPDFHVVLLPDLYPRNQGFSHETADELLAGMQNRFVEAAKAVNVDAEEIQDRFHTFCLKYELEALVLAAEEALKEHLDTDAFDTTWERRVEDQNHDKPPTQVVEEVFRENRSRYVKGSDAPEILIRANYRIIADRCPQQFRPFVEFLEGL
jgi:hypothetical protein